MLLPGALGQSQSTSAALRGTVRTLEGRPGSGAAVLIHDAGQDVDQTIAAGPDGGFQIGNLTPGHYQLTATKAGFVNSSATSVELAAGQTRDLTLTLGPAARPKGLLKRLLQAYSDDWNGTAPSAPAAHSRLPPSPLNSPPFPNADWPYGGSPDIGAPDTNVPPLMQALYAGPDGKAW